jgi:nicotinamidase-related amidase
MTRCGLLLCLFLTATLTAAPPADAPRKTEPGGPLKVTLRTRVEPFKGTETFEEVSLPAEFDPRTTALILCDIWDDHWCTSAARRCDVLARKTASVVDGLRSRGVLIIHAPSDCMDFYKDTPQRQRALQAQKVVPPANRDLPDPPLPVDSSDGGCDDEKPAREYRAWMREHPAITVAAEDVVSDNGAEVYNVLQERGIKTLLVAGVHTNMCVLHRSFAIKQMTRWGVRCVLVRDLTDAMYNPKKPPFVSHEEGTERIIQFIEKYWCPTVLSKDLLPQGK